MVDGSNSVRHRPKERTVIVTNPFAPGSWTRDEIDTVSRGWWVLVATGVLSVVAGGIILFTDWSIADLATFIGLLLIFRGIFMTFGAPVDGSARGWSIALGFEVKSLPTRADSAARDVDAMVRRRTVDAAAS
jgi:hypothetical protein